MSLRRRPGTFDRLAETWWPDDGVLHGLGALLDPVRLPFIEEAFQSELGSGGHRVLDLGAGAGRLSEELARRGHAVVAFDPSLRSLHAGQYHAAAADLDGISFGCGIGERPPFRSASFDAVVCMEVLEHVGDPGTVILEAARVLRPGGVFVFSGPNRTPASRLALVFVGQQLLGVIPRGTHEFRRLLRPAETESLMHAAGVSPVRTVGVGIRWRDVPRSVAVVAGLLARRLSHAEAGRRIRLTSERSTTLAYQGYGVRLGTADRGPGGPTA